MSKQPERRRRFVRAFAPAVGLLAAGLLVWQGSYAAFTATTSNNADPWSTGNLALTNNGGNGATYSDPTTATFGGTALTPGSTKTQCLTVKSAGSLAGSLKMYMSSLTDSTSSPTLGSQINLVVTAAPTTNDISTGCTNFPTTGTTPVYTGSLTDFPATYSAAGGAVAVASGTQKIAYQVSWTVNSNATNALQGQTATAAFTWEIDNT